jgi:hypothetical protein
VPANFHRASFAVRAARCDPESGNLQFAFVFRIYFIVAEVLFVDCIGVINRTQQRPLLYPDTSCTLGARFGNAQATGVITIFFEMELCSPESASGMPSTLRAYSTRVCWNPPQVPTNGQLRVLANSMPRNIPSKLRYGLPGDANSRS